MKIVARAFLCSTVLKFSVRNHRAALMGLMRAGMIFFIFPSWSVFWTFSHSFQTFLKSLSCCRSDLMISALFDVL